jgi:hypothetical protein
MKTKKEQTPNTSEPLYKRIKAHVGRPPKFETAGDLLEMLVRYCEYCDANPIKVNVRSKMKRNSNTGDSSELGNVTIKRPYTLDGFCLFAGILMPWATFKNNAKRRKDWSDFEIVINACEQVIRDQQITGAMIGVYSERLTARLNGISDRIEHDVNAQQTTISFDDYCKMMRGENIES